MEDRFGFVPLEKGWNVGEYRISPLDSFRTIVEGVLEESHEEQGFCDPPIAHTWRHAADGSGHAVPRSRHVAFLYPVVATHRIEAADSAFTASREEWRKSEGGFLINALGYLLRLRCLFHDFRFDTRIPVRESPICIMTDRDIEQVLTNMLVTYRTWPARLRLRFANALYLKSRNLALQWSWERFSAEYVVFDALYACTRDRELVSGGTSRTHAGRFKQLGTANLIHWDTRHETETEHFVLFRNDLVHEGLWLAGAPTRDGYWSGHQTLTRLNDRLALTVADIDCSFRLAPWSTMSNFVLGLRHTAGSRN